MNREKLEVRPILLVRPWEKELFFASELRRLGYAYETVPVAVRTNRDPLRVVRVAHRLQLSLKAGKFDLVHTNGYFADICGQLAALMLGIRSISTCHGFIKSDLKMRVYNRLDTYALRLCERVIAVSEVIKDDLVRSGLRESRITVIPNAVSPLCSGSQYETRRHCKRSQLNIALGEHVVGFLGRLSAEKGVAYLIESVSELLKAGVQMKLVIVGDGPERCALEQQVKTRQIESAVVFTGFQTDPESWFPAFDIFALPSLTEGTPLALLESMAAGVPVIASAVGGVPKIVTDGENGLLVPPGAPSAIKEKIQCLHADKMLSLRLGKAGKETIQTKFSISDWCLQIENCYNEVNLLKKLITKERFFRSD